ncbi:hypothetical protein [Paenibacillus sambharensis]|nr:hypothetical protein [Paenibacillus sambharensis]
MADKQGRPGSNNPAGLSAGLAAAACGSMRKKYADLKYALC